MRYRTLYELMDHYQDDEVDLAEESPVDTDRVLEMTMSRLGPQAASRRRAAKRRPARNTLRTALIAAAIAAAMSVTAYAVYQATVEDYIIPEETAEEQVPPPAIPETEAPAEPTDAPVSRLSLVGYQGTPEYEAYVEWDTWQKENPTDFSAVDNDDSYFETEKNYAALYGAYFKAQAEKLDEIMAKHGLVPLEDMHFVYAPEEVYDFLGTDPFLPEGSWGSGYVYNDGTFKLEAIDFGTEDLNGTLFVSCKGSFARIFGGVPADYEEWSYTTASGQTVDLVMGTNGALMLLETDGAYIHLSVNMGTEAVYRTEDMLPISKEQYTADLQRDAEDGAISQEALAEAMENIDEKYQEYLDINFGDVDLAAPIQSAYTKADLEKLADSVGFDVLAERFDGSVTREQATEDYYAFIQRLESATDTYNRTEDADAAIAAIGDYYLKDLEGFSMYSVSGQTADDPMVGDGCNYVIRRYQGSAGGGIDLSWSDATELSELSPLKETEDGEEIYPETEQVTVQGHEARYWSDDEIGAEVEWLDQEQGLRFRVTAWWGGSMGVPWTLEKDELLAIAESVTAQ